MWHLGPGLIVVPVERAVRTRRAVSLLVSAAGAAAWVLFLLAGFTGYLGPSHSGNTSLGTIFRFRLLHLVITPALVLVLGVFIAWRMRRYATDPRHRIQVLGAGPQTP
jgi:uncharacterized RDD family membrane protein YckC